MAFLYARISPTNGNADIRVQLDMMRSYCSLNSIEIVQEDINTNLSGKDGENLIILRDDVKEVLPQLKFFVVTDCTRLCRSKVEGIKFVNYLIESGVDFISVEDNIDSRNEGWRANMEEKLAFSEYEYLKIKERTTKGIQRAWNAGKLSYAIPYGYLNVTKSIVHPEEHPILLKLLALSHNAIQPEYIASYLNRKGHKYRDARWSSKDVVKVVKKMRKGGEYRYRLIEEGIDDAFHPSMKKFFRL